MLNSEINELPEDIDVISLLKGDDDISVKRDREECNNATNIYSKKCNEVSLQFEKEQSVYLQTINPNDTEYPLLDDPNFNLKITNKKEFADMGYNGSIYADIKKRANQLNEERFELSPHQIFVKNYLSLQTPYNSLLLYHGLGTGKTCSAIGICEEMRKYMVHIGRVRKIIIVASPNVQDNFRLQLFDESKLKLIDGKWDIQSCLGTSLIQELNPTIFEGVSGITREKLIYQIKNLIDSSYLFLGYVQFANLIDNVIQGNVRSIDEYVDMVEGSKLESEQTKKIKKKISDETSRKRLQSFFSNRMIVIDEIHNIRYSSENANKIVAEKFTKLISTAINVRLVLMTATPMYNNYKEIVWLINIMNINDRRGIVKLSDIFDENGNFVVDEKGNEIGKEQFIRKMNGYVSFVRGENPYTFPYRIYPNEFSLSNTLKNVSSPNGLIPLPTRKLNGSIIEEKERLKYLIPFVSRMSSYQETGYSILIQKLHSHKNFTEMKTFGYKMLLSLIYATNIIYPCSELDALDENKDDDDITITSDLGNFDENYDEVYDEDEEMIGGVKTPVDDENEDEFIAEISDNEEEDSEGEGEESEGEDEDEGEESEDEGEESVKNVKRIRWNTNKIIGTDGLRSIMNYKDSMKPPIRGEFEYKEGVLEKYGRIFGKENIGKYSCKINAIMDSIFIPSGLAEGIILIYTQYINAGIVPIALALEERGITRYGDINNNLFKDKPCEDIDSITGKLRKEVSESEEFQPATYIVISGDSRLSKNNDNEIKECVRKQNAYGKNIKVILITRTGSEGIDFKNIRQVHILDPWYNMNRNEQIIGRAVRNFSHRDLEFEKRNVMIYLHCTVLTILSDEETADMYMYRISELKSIIMGKISRVMKENAIDCFINSQQKNFTQLIMSKYTNPTITQILSNGAIIDDYKVGDVPYSSICDYMQKCGYKCSPQTNITEIIGKDKSSYGLAYVETNMMRLVPKIKDLFKNKTFYKKAEIIRLLNYSKKYPIEEIEYALTYILNDKTTYLYDSYGRVGSLVNILDYYLFQPVELNPSTTSLFEKSTPVDFKHKTIRILYEPDHKDTNETKQQERTTQPKNNVDESESDANKPNDIDLKMYEREFQIQLGKPVFGKIMEFYLSSKMYYDDPSLPLKGMKDYYKHAGYVSRYLHTSVDIPSDVLLDYIICHSIDELNKQDKLNLLNYIVSYPSSVSESQDNTTLFVESVNKYFEKKYIDYHNNIVIPLGDSIYIKQSGVFVLANDVISLEIYDMLEEAWVPYVENYPEKLLNNIVGFIDYENKSNILLFKLRDTRKEYTTNKSGKVDKRIFNTSGFVATTAGKSKAVDIVNVIINTHPSNVSIRIENFTKENSKKFIELDICIIQELLLRYYENSKDVNDRLLYFYSYETSVIMRRIKP